MRAKHLSPGFNADRHEGAEQGIVSAGTPTACLCRSRLKALSNWLNVRRSRIQGLLVADLVESVGGFGAQGRSAPASDNSRHLVINR